MENKEIYVSPEATVKTFGICDIITASDPWSLDNENGMDDIFNQ